jgi:phenylacetate-CoA ligase
MYKDFKTFYEDLNSKDEDFWIKEGEKMSLELFYGASKRVPAYRDFLAKNKIDPESIRTIADLTRVPTVDKKNYLTVYPLEDLCWDGEITSADMVSLSSGSSGEPFFWLRGKPQEKETCFSHEAFLVDSFGIDKQSTLFIVSFSMGMWVAGTLTYCAAQDIAAKYKMTVITPGINQKDVLKVIKSLGSKYEQIIIAGYPPLVKDIIDEGDDAGIDWKKNKIKFLFAAEAFSEKWRDYICGKVDANDPCKDSLNIYGTADALILGHETPLSIFIRRGAINNPKLYKDVFSSEERMPTLVQYNPMFRFFEVDNGSLVFSAFSGIPLVRYNIGDSGGIIKYSGMREILSANGIDMDREAKSSDISRWQLPFMYVFGRSDHTASLYGINIYPENIRAALENERLNDFVSGKFTMLTKTDEKMDQYLEVNVELKSQFSKIPENLAPILKEVIMETLKSKSTEYTELKKALGTKADPRINICLYNDERFFHSGVKQKWHKKDVI